MHSCSSLKWRYKTKDKKRWFTNKKYGRINKASLWKIDDDFNKFQAQKRAEYQGFRKNKGLNELK